MVVSDNNFDVPLDVTPSLGKLLLLVILRFVQAKAKYRKLRRSPDHTTQFVNDWSTNRLDD